MSPGQTISLQIPIKPIRLILRSAMVECLLFNLRTDISWKILQPTVTLYETKTHTHIYIHNYELRLYID